MARSGRLTASSVSIAVDKLNKGGPVNYAAIAQNVYTSKQRNSFTTAAMRWGIEHEKTALETYKEHYPNMNVIEKGLCIDRKESEYVACSPDGIAIDLKTGETILLEVKCPFSVRDCNNIHRAIANGKIPWLQKFPATKNKPAQITINRLQNSQGRSYYNQIQTSLKILDLNRCHLIVWTPRSCLVLNVPRSALWETETWLHLKRIGEELHCK